MKKKEWNEGLNHIDPALVEAYVLQNDMLGQTKSKTKGAWLRLGAAAACLAVIAGAIVAVSMLREADPAAVPMPPNDSAAEIVVPSPPAYSSYEYESYEAVCAALTNRFSPQYMQLRLEQENCGAVYRQTLSDFASGEIRVAVPQINGEALTLRDREGFSNITWFTSELYHLPWLWYHGLADGRNLTVSIAYPCMLDRAELESAASYYRVQRMISPDSPSPDNYEESASYRNIYEKEITLADGKTVTAMISELKNDSRIYVCLYLDGMLVRLQGDEALLTEDFLRTFSIAYTE